VPELPTVTCLFGDIEDSTELLQQLGPRDVAFEGGCHPGHSSPILAPTRTNTVL
jgi:hypothetical protein